MADWQPQNWRSPPASFSPGIYPPGSASYPIGMDALQHQEPGDTHFSSPQSPTSPVASFSRQRTSSQYYSPLPLINPYSEVPRRKSIPSSYSSHSVNTTDSRATGRSASVSDSQHLLGDRGGDPPIALNKDDDLWRIQWWTPFTMIGLFVLGVISAIVHHAFYKSLDGREARDQLTKIRYGTGMAVFTKATLVGSVVVAYRQRIWYTFRRKAMSLGAIDSLFAVVDDPTMFWEKDMVSNAKVATVMAVAVWFIPLAAVLSPASLTSNIVIITNSTTCPSVPNLNFSAESYNNYRHPPILDGYFGISLSYSNTTDHNGTTPGYFDYWDQPSKNAVRLATVSRYLQRPIERNGVSEQVCGSGWNCTYSISFTGPGYKCTELASGVNSNTTELAQLGAPFDTSVLVPEGTNIYQAVVDLGDYAHPQTPSNDFGEPIQKPPPADLGVFKTEPVLWIGYTVNTSQPYPPESPLAGNLSTVKIPKIFMCEHYETDYEVFFNYTNGQQNTTVTNRTFLHPIIDTSLAKFPNGTLDPSNALPTSNWVRPNTNVPHYKLTAAYHSVGALIRPSLSGSIRWTGVPITFSDVSETQLIDQRIFYPVPDLQHSLQLYYENIILSLLSDPHLIIATNSSVPCTKTRAANLFRYHVQGLWPFYAIVIAIALASLVAGLAAMRDNGVDSDTYFSRIVATTRNPTLDRLSRGGCLGGRGRMDGWRGMKVKFGELVGAEGAEGVAHCAFGVEGEIRPIWKGGRYAGLGGTGEVEEKKDTQNGLDETGGIKHEASGCRRRRSGSQR